MEEEEKVTLGFLGWCTACATLGAADAACWMVLVLLVVLVHRRTMDISQLAFCQAGLGLPWVKLHPRN